MRTLLAALATAALIALVPAAALAQDAGSQQYEDPLAGDTSGGGGGGGGGNSGGAGGGNTGSSSNGNAQADAGTGTESAGESDGLPRTGFDAWLLLLTSGALMAGGFALRRIADRPGA
jgi:hypothetical protein